MEHTHETIRTFLALDLSEVSKEWIENRKRELARAMKGAVRWVKGEGLHVTLHFFGEIPQTALDRIQRTLTPVAAASAPLTLQVRGLGAFPSPRRPRVLWAGIRETDGMSGLQRLHAAVEEALEREGFPVESRPFAAHVTMGRVKKSLWIPWEQFRDLPPCAPFQVHGMVLYQSILTPRGARYRPLTLFSFGGEQHG